MARPGFLGCNELAIGGLQNNNGRGDPVSYEHINCDLDGPIMTVTLNRPDKFNAYTGQMGAEIADAFEPRRWRRQRPRYHRHRRGPRLLRRG